MYNVTHARVFSTYRARVKMRGTYKMSAFEHHVSCLHAVLS